MNKKFLMYFLLFSFLAAVLFLVFIYFSKKNPATTSLQSPFPKATPTVIEPTLPPVLADPYVQKGMDLVTDLKNINLDVERIAEEDPRLIPPSFTLEKEVTQ